MKIKRRNYTLPTCGLLKKHLTHLWFKKWHFTSNVYPPLSCRYSNTIPLKKTIAIESKHFPEGKKKKKKLLFVHSLLCLLISNNSNNSKVISCLAVEDLGLFSLRNWRNPVLDFLQPLLWNQNTLLLGHLHSWMKNGLFGL